MSTGRKVLLAIFFASIAIVLTAMGLALSGNEPPLLTIIIPVGLGAMVLSAGPFVI